VASKIKLKVEKAGPDFESAVWSKATAEPGEELELRVTAKPKAGEEVWFVLRQGTTVLRTLKAGTATKAKWVVPNVPGLKVKFQAQLRVAPTPQNGHTTIQATADSVDLTVGGFKLELQSIDAAFVPKQEKLEAKWKLEDAGGAAKKGRIEVWGERYPTEKPLYVEEFTPAAGVKSWTTWDGKAKEAGPLKDKLLTPEFSPYRLVVRVGTDSDAVKDPFGKGKGKHAWVEGAFEVTFQNVEVRVQSGLEPHVRSDLGHLLAVGAPSGNGLWASTGRLPDEGETARIRIPGMRCSFSGDTLDQQSAGQPAAMPSAPNGWDRYAVDGAYMGGGNDKFTNEALVYHRPEIPLELAGRLRSRDKVKNPKGLFEKEAMGPARFEVHADDAYQSAKYTSGPGPQQTYFQNAGHLVKDGGHLAITNDGANPVIGYWQERFVVAADGDRDFTVTGLRRYTGGSSELTVWLNRTKLVVGASGSKKDVEEEAGGAGKTKIKLKEKLTKKDDVLWVFREPKAAAPATAVANWAVVPGNNVHAHYGGLRGGAVAADESHTRLFRKSFSPAVPAPRKVIGRQETGTYAFKDAIELDPEGVPVADRRRVLVKTIDKAGDAKQGLTGLIFSPSYLGGDAYTIEARLPACPYERDPGFVGPPLARGVTGKMEVWRTPALLNSIRLHTTFGGANTAANLPLAVGIPDTDPTTRAHPGVGVGMNFANLGTLYADGFQEWVTPRCGMISVDAGTGVTALTVVRPGGNGFKVGDIVQIYGGHELMEVVAPAPTATQVNVTRGARGTTKVAITKNSKLYVRETDNGGPKLAVLDAEAGDADVTLTVPAPQGLKFVVGDIIQADGGAELMRVSGASTATAITVTRAHGGTVATKIAKKTLLVSHTCVVAALTGDLHNEVFLGPGAGSYIDTHDGQGAALGVAGWITIGAPANVTNDLVQWDHYRWQLPPGVPGNRQNVASNTIALQAAGTASATIAGLVAGALAGHVGPGDAVLAGGATAIPNSPVGWNQTTYKNAVVNNVWAASAALLDALTPKDPQAKAMQALRWPEFYQPGRFWIHGSGTIAGLGIAGFASGDAQSFFLTSGGNPDTFEHEMGHSLNLAHFAATGFDLSGVTAMWAGGNCAWKHHDHGHQSCLMSYWNGHTHFIERPPPPVGWPATVGVWGGPAHPVSGVATIPISSGASRNTLCGKCLLKLRGWNEVVLPCNWAHPDLF